MSETKDLPPVVAIVEKNLLRRIFEEWLWWTGSFAIFVIFAWGFSNISLIDWLNSTIGLADPMGPYSGIKKWMFLLGLYTILFAAKVVGMIRCKD